MKVKQFLLAIVMGIILLPISSMASSTTSGILRVVGQPGNGQPNDVFIEKCQTGKNGKLVKFSCGIGSVFTSLFDGKLNSDTVLPPGLYAVSYDELKLDNFIQIKSGQTTTIRLEKVEFPAGINPNEVRVILDLKDSQELAHYLDMTFAQDTLEQYLYEKQDAPATPENKKFFNAMVSAKKPADLLGVLFTVDANGFPQFWNVFHNDFTSSSYDGCGTACLWAGSPSGDWVAVLPGGTYTFEIFSGHSIAPVSYIFGVHSKPE